ncbi:MAG TPA: hypothetical protein VEY07_07200 [Thermoplasmata archaeon]|nr:hypothetical protein [Thermoplasmata archaeon]
MAPFTPVVALKPLGFPASPPTPPREPEAPSPFPLASRLDQPANYDQVFRVVRGAVRHVLGIERPGLGLGLSNLPPSLGAYWQVTGNLIVLNEGLVHAMRTNATSTVEFNSYVFVVLAHEYLHSLGYLDEREVRRVTAHVARAAFGGDHPATRMAEGDIWRMYPFLQYAPRGDGRRFRVVTQFDLDTTQNYIR